MAGSIPIASSPRSIARSRIVDAPRFVSDVNAPAANRCTDSPKVAGRPATGRQQGPDLSAVAAIFRFDGGDVVPGAIDAMTAAMDFAGTDGIASWQRGGVALGHCMLRTTAESLEEAQPLGNEDESLMLVFDGWLENPAELREELLRRGMALRNRSDAELVLRAWECWGEDSPIRLEGEYAFVVWDARQRVAHCVRDHAGMRPLCYHWDRGQLVVASYLPAVLAAPGVPQRLNKGTAAEILINESITRGETMWEGVLRVQPAQMVRCGKDGPVARTWWEPPLEVTLRYRSDEEYREHYLALLGDCVARASRSHLPVACDVSGGLDSSAIFAVAHDLARKGRLPAPGIKGYTYLFENGTPADELAYARAVARHVGAPVREIEPFLPDLEWFFARGRANCDMVPYPNATMANAIGDAVRADGCRVSLNGEGGDEWLGGKPHYYAEQLSEGDLRGAFRSLREDAADMGLPATIRRIARFGILPLAPEWARNLRRRLVPRRGNESDWLGPELSAIVARRREESDAQDFGRIRNPARRGMYMTLKDIWNEITRDALSLQAARLGIESRTPMYSRRFIEFAFKTPERLRLHGNRRKYLHACAMQELLPPEVTQRQTKAEFSLAFERHLSILNGPNGMTWPFTGHGFLDSGGLERLCRKYRDKPLYSRPVWELWAVLACDDLLRAERDRELRLGHRGIPGRATQSEIGNG